jgi:glycosyltransferase involved in cell wall biosynthesis
MTRVAFVVQRYGSTIVGGAEYHARLVAESLVSRCGWQVEVYTTTALDYQNWASAMPEGTDQLNSVTIHRFDPKFLRAPRTMHVLSLAIRVTRKIFRSRLQFLQRGLESLWIMAQGPYVPGLKSAVIRDHSRFDAIIFFTYLYYPTLQVLPAVAAKSILVPTAHDEFPFYFKKVSTLLRRSRFIAANTESESVLIRRVHSPVSEIRIVGLGFDRQLQSWDGPTEDYALYLGRIGKGKGCQELLDNFVAFKAAHPGSKLKLLLAGHLESDIVVPNCSDIRLLGFLDEEEKWRAISGARFLINSSSHESLSMIALEAMAAGIPLLLNGHCEVFREYSSRCESVVTYSNQSEFISFCADLEKSNRADPVFASKLEQSRNWVLSNYSWASVCEKFKQMVADLVHSTRKN